MINLLHPRIIIIDDRKEEINGIISRLNKDGIGCRYFDADLNSGDKYPEKPIEGIKLIFLDLYYGDKFDAELCSSWIQALVTEFTYFGLILWTRDVDKQKDVLEQLKKINRNPIFCFSKLKNDYRSNSDYEFEFDKLLDDLNTEINKLPTFQIFLTWEHLVNKSAVEIIKQFSEFYDITDMDSDKKHLNILYKMATAYAGKQLINDNKEIIRNSLLTFNDIFQDTLEKNINNHKFTMSESFDKNIIIDKNVIGEINRKLNMTFENINGIAPGCIYVDNSIYNEKKIEGINYYKDIPNEIEKKVFEDFINKIVIKTDKEFISNLYVIDDNNQKYILKNSIHEADKNKILLILNIYQYGKSIISNIFNFNNINEKIIKDFKISISLQPNTEIPLEKKEDFANYYKTILDTLKPIELEVSPLCDYAQNKWTESRIIKGRLCPLEYGKYINNAPFLYTTPIINLKIDNKLNSYFLIFNFLTLYSINIEERKRESLVILCKIRHSLLVDIQTRLSHHISRPGLLYISPDVQ